MCDALSASNPVSKKKKREVIEVTAEAAEVAEELGQEPFQVSR